MGLSLDILRRHNLIPKLPDLIFLTPLSKWSLSLRCQGCVFDLSTGSGHPTVSFSLYVDQLWLPSICPPSAAKDSSLVRVRVTLISESKGER